VDVISVSIDLRGGRVRLVCVTPSGVTTPLYLDDDPSAPAGVALDPDSGTLYTGAPAAAVAVTAPQRLVTDPLAGLDTTTLTVDGREVDPVDVLATVLARIRGEIEAVTGTTPSAIAVVTPPQWGPRRHARVRAALARAGLPEPTLVAAPAAAATYATLRGGVEAPVGAVLLVIDTTATAVTCSLVHRISDIGWDILATLTGPTTPNGAKSPTVESAHAASATEDADAAGQRLAVVTDATSVNVLDAADIDSAGIAAAIRVGPQSGTPVDQIAGIAVVALPRAGDAAVLGASQHLHNRHRTATALVTTPPAEGFTRQILGIVLLWAASLGLAVHTITNAVIIYDWDPQYIGTYLYSLTELAAACALAMTAALFTARSIIQTLITRPYTPATSNAHRLGPVRAMLGATAVGGAVCAVYALLAAAIFDLPDSWYLPTAMKAAPAGILIGLATAALLPRLAYLGSGMLRQFRTPVTATILATGGILLGEYGLVHPAPAATIRIAGAAIIAACGWTLTRSRRTRTVVVPAAALIGALATRPSTIPADTVIYIICAYTTLAAQLVGVVTDAYPALWTRITRH
jgi:hypothetical protein